MDSLAEYLKAFSLPYSITDAAYAGSLYKPRNAFSNKGHFGHALLIAGSFGKMGAALLAAKACLCSGVGLLTSHVPGCGYPIIQTAIPEAMVTIDEDEHIPTKITTDISRYSVIGIGPGIGDAEQTRALLGWTMDHFRKPMLLDADALNLLSKFPDMKTSVPQNSVLTPHPKEFDRLFGKQENEFARFSTASEQAKQMNVVIVVKGHYTAIAMPDGRLFFNTTGNVGMAKGGSGDALSGIITALLAQQYDPAAAAILGVYLHGFAGDLAAADCSVEAMLPSDLIDRLGKAYLKLSGTVAR